MQSGTLGAPFTLMIRDCPARPWGGSWRGPGRPSLESFRFISMSSFITAFNLHVFLCVRFAFRLSWCEDELGGEPRPLPQVPLGFMVRRLVRV